MIIYGKQVFLYTLTHHPHIIQTVLLQKNIESSLFSQIKKLNIPIQRLDFKKAQALAKGGNHQGYLMDVIPPAQNTIKDLMSFASLLVLEGVSDTHNIGALFRSVYCLGFDAVILTQISSFCIEGAIRTSSGALLDVPFACYKDSLSLANELKMAGFKLYGAVLDGEITSDQLKSYMDHKVALFLGSEGEGLRKKLRSKMDYRVSIQLAHHFNSLNVGVAAAILMDRMRDGRK